MFQFRTPTTLPIETEPLPGRPNPIPTADRHFVTGRSIKAPFPAGMETALFGLGCFWGAERLFWVEPGVHVTAVGYAGGVTPNPTYEEVRSGLTGHSEIVLVAYDPGVIDYTDLVARFFEGHDPTQGMRQGDDIGTQYRSCIFGSEAQLAIARGVKTAYQLILEAKGFGAITTEILTTPAFYYAEADHQQYLAKNPDASCGLRGTGVACPIGSRAEAG